MHAYNVAGHHLDEALHGGVSQTGMRGHDERQASMVSPYVRGRAEIHVSSSSISAVKASGAGSDGALSRMVTSRTSETGNVGPAVCLIQGHEQDDCPRERMLWSKIEAAG